MGIKKNYIISGVKYSKFNFFCGVKQMEDGNSTVEKTANEEPVHS